MRVNEIHVLVATTFRDLTAEVLSAAVSRCADMRLIGDRVVSAAEIEELLTELPPFATCALVLVGRASDTEPIETHWIERRKRLVVLRIDIPEDVMHVSARQVGMDSLLSALRDLVRCAALSASAGVARKSPTELLRVEYSESRPLRYWRQCVRHIDLSRSLYRAVTNQANSLPLRTPSSFAVPKG